jgi:hypothetical protein
MFSATDSVAMRPVRHVAAEHLDGPRLDLARARDQREHARLADAVGADQPHHALRPHVEADGLERMPRAVAEADVAQRGDR